MTLDELPHDILSLIFNCLHWLDVIKIHNICTSIQQFVFSGVWCTELQDFHQLSTPVLSNWLPRFTRLSHVQGDFCLQDLLLCLRLSHRTISSLDVTLLPLSDSDFSTSLQSYSQSNDKSFRSCSTASIRLSTHHSSIHGSYNDPHHSSIRSLKYIKLYGDSHACCVLLCYLASTQVQSLTVLPTSRDHVEAYPESNCVELLGTFIKSNCLSLKYLRLSHFHLELWSKVFSSLRRESDTDERIISHHALHLDRFSFSNVPVPYLPELPAGSSVKSFWGGNYRSVDDVIASQRWLKCHYTSEIEIGTLIIDVIVDIDVWGQLPRIFRKERDESPQTFIHGMAPAPSQESLPPDRMAERLSKPDTRNSNINYASSPTCTFDATVDATVDVESDIAVPNALVLLHREGLIERLNDLHIRLRPEVVRGDALRDCRLWTQNQVRDNIKFTSSVTISTMFPEGRVPELQMTALTNLSGTSFVASVNFFKLLRQKLAGETRRREYFLS